MKPLVVLFAAFFLSLLTSRIWGSWNYILAGNIAMAAMLLFTAVGHIKYGKGMELMIPDFIPFKPFFVQLTTILEIMAAIGLLIPDLRSLTALLLMLFFLTILPANINAAFKKLSYEKAGQPGPGSNYLWFRIPLQLFFIAWAWYFGIYAE